MFRTERIARVLCSIGFASSIVACASANDPPTSDGLPQVEPINFSDKADTPVRGELADAAQDYVRATPELTAPGDEWRVRASGIGRDGFQHVRMYQYHEGVRVWGGDVVVHASGSRFKTVNGNRVKNLDGFDLSVLVNEGTALDTAKGHYHGMAKTPDAPIAFDRESTELVIYPQPGRDARLAWHTEFYTEVQAGLPPGLWNYFVDAKTGDIITSFNALDTLSQASGPGGNAKVPRTWTDALDVEPSGAQFAMDTARLQTYNLAGGTGAGTIVVGPLSNIGDAPINDAHGFAEVTLNMLQDWYGHNSINDAGFVIKSRVHYSTNYENAFWDGTQMTYGDGASIFYPLSGDVDVVAHEINHGFTSFHSNLVYSQMSGGMNESFSDISGTIAEHFIEGAGADWDLGRDIFRADSALRFMCDPTADGISIDHASNYNDGIDVHYSSGIFNKAFCLTARRFASGDPGGPSTVDSTRRAGEAWYAANASYWVSSSTFTQGCQGVIDAAVALGFSDTERTAIRDSFIDVGVYCDGAVEPLDCDDTFTADSGEVTSPNFPANYPDNFNRTYCIIPSSGQPATLHFTAFNTESGYDFVTIKDANGVELSRTSGQTAPADATSTILSIKFTSDSSVTAPGWRATWDTGGTNNEPPTVAITSPANGSTVSGTVNVAATAADSDGTVAKVTFTLPDGTTVEDNTAPYETAWDSTTVADGNYNIGAVSTDNLGVNSAPASVAVTVSNAVSCVDGTFSATNLPRNIPDNNSTGIGSPIIVSGGGVIGSVSVSLNITHTWIGDLRVVLRAPGGQQYVIHDRTGGSADNLVITDMPVPVFAGTPAAGRWALRVSDNAGADVGRLMSWSITIVGDCSPPQDWNGKSEPNLALVDNGSACSTLTIAGATGDAAGTGLDADGTHTWRAALRGTLSHNGVTVDAFPAGTFSTGGGTFSLANRAVTGLSGDVNGDWTLCIIDVDAYNDTGVLTSWSVHD